MKRRAITFLLAVLISALGTTGVLAYVHGANARALAGQQAVTVLVAAQPIPAGTQAGQAQRQGLLRAEKWPAATVPADAMRSITPGQASLIVSAEVQPGELLLRPMLGSAASDTSGLPIPAGLTAVTIDLCAPEAVAGYVHPGSLVALYQTSVKSGTLSAQPACNLPHQQQAGAVIESVLSQALVLAVSAGPALRPGGTQTSGAVVGQAGSTATESSLLLTLAVSPADAPRVILLSETGLPYLTLLPGSS